MKKILFFVLLLISVVLNAVNIKFLSQKTDMIKLEINFDYDHNFVTLPLNHSLDEDYILFDEIKIPFYKANLIIPDFDSLKVTYEVATEQYQKLSYQYYDFADTLKAIIPNDVVKISEPFILRDFRGIMLNFFPFHVDSQSEWKIITKLYVTIESKSPFGKNPLRFRHNKIPLYFDSIYQNFFANYHNFRNDNIIPEKMLVIAPDGWDDLTLQYAENKINEGIGCEKYSYPQDTGISGDEIRNFIKNRYEENPALTFVTLIGDETLIPTPDNFLQNDRQYSFLEGDDNFPEITVGRLYLTNTEDVNPPNNNEMTANKILFGGYLQNLPAEDKYVDIYPKQTAYKEVFCSGENYQSIKELIASPQSLYFLDDNAEFEKNQYQYNKIYTLGLFNIFKNALYKRNNFLFYSQIYTLFSLFHNSSDFINLQDASERIILGSDEICKTNYKIETYQPLSVSIKTTRNFKPLANSEIFLISDGDIISSKYSDNFGSADFYLSNFNKPFVQVGSYNKFCGFNYNFITIKEPPIAADTTGVSIKCYPNPFYPAKAEKNLANISYEIKKETFVSISIYNIIGQTVKNIYSGLQMQGDYIIKWDGKDNNEQFVTSGIYYVMIKSKNKTETAKILLIK